MSAPRILIVEDEAVVAADIAAQLAGMGYEVSDNVTDGEEALASIEKRRPDLVLMDIRLKNGPDGIETAREVQRRHRTPVVFLTADAEDETLERAGPAGPYGYILKPFRDRDLKSAVEVALTRHAAEMALQESEERFRQLAANIEEVFWICSTDWSEVFYVSPAYETVWGRSCQSLHDNPRSWMDSLAEEDRAALLRGIDRMAPGGMDFRIRRPDGSLRWIHAQVYPIRDAQGRVYRIAGVARDISGRKQAEETLREKERALEALLDNMPGMAYRCLADERWTMEFVSEGCMGIFGYPPSNLLGNAEPGFAALIHPDDRERIREEVLRAVDRREQYRLTYRILTRSGPVRHVWEQGMAIAFPEGGPAVLEGFITDITERRELEARLLHSQKMDAFGQLAGGVAHDFNNILAANMIHLGLLSMRTDLVPEIRDSIQEMQDNANRGANLTRQLLMFSRRSALETKSVDLNEIVTNMSRILGRIIGEHIDLQFQRGAALPRIEADPGMMEQVLMNLAVNARDAMPRGGRIVIATERLEVDAATAAANPDRRPGSFLRLSVRDTGHGMDQAVMERIFEPFFTTKEAGKGTGMGLATIHGIVAQHKGWIEVESEVGQGTTFRILLPALSDASGLRTAETAGKEDVPSGHETILLVEDERILRDMIVGSLGTLGYRILEAADGREAMGLWKEHGPRVDLLLTDMVMPRGMTGLELAEKLLQEKPQLKVIVTSGYTGELGHAGIPPGGRISFLPKPYNLTRLAQLVRTCVENGEGDGSGAVSGAPPRSCEGS